MMKKFVLMIMVIGAILMCTGCTDEQPPIPDIGNPNETTMTEKTIVEEIIVEKIEKGCLLSEMEIPDICNFNERVLAYDWSTPYRTRTIAEIYSKDGDSWGTIVIDSVCREIYWRGTRGIRVGTLISGEEFIAIEQMLEKAYAQ